MFWFIIGFLLLIVVLLCYYGPRTDYEWVINGVTRRGWQLAIPERHLQKNYHRTSWSLVCESDYHKGLSISDIGDWVPQSSVFLLLVNPSITGGSVISVNQYSLIQPSSSNTLLKIVAGYPYSGVSMCYLSSRIVLITCNQGSLMRLFLVDIIARTSRNFTIETPDTSTNVSFTLAYVSSDPKPRLHIVFEKHSSLADEAEDDRVEFIDATYDCHGLEANPSILKPLSSTSIEFPEGNCVLEGSSLFGVVSISCDIDDLLNMDMHRCISFDRHEGWRMETLTRWLAGFRGTQEGESIMNAAKAFVDLDPPQTLNLLGVLMAAIRVRHLFGVPGGNDLLATTYQSGILRRVVKTPSMKRLAANSIFRAHPGLKIFEVEKATGVDISDGIRDDRAEEDVKTVYL